LTTQQPLLTTILAVFSVHHASSLYACRFSCGHTNMYCHQVYGDFIAVRRKQMVGKSLQCYKKHDETGNALPTSVDPQQEADELFATNHQQCIVCGGIDGQHNEHEKVEGLV